VGGLKAGSTVDDRGVEIGRVESNRPGRLPARVTLRASPVSSFSDGSIASIKTKGADRREITSASAPGGSDKIIPHEREKIREVEAPVDFEELLSKYIFGKV